MTPHAGVTIFSKRGAVSEDKLIFVWGCQYLIGGINGRHITTKLEVVFSTFFATYNDREGFTVQFGLCSIKIC